jgi:lysophospholipase L1-like esterase
MRKTIALSLLACLVALLIGECLARLVVTVGDDVAHSRQSAEERWLQYAPDLGWVRKPGFKGEVGGAEREFDAAGYFTVDSAQLAASGRKRVIFIGDSNTFGFGAATAESFAEVAERRLGDINAINLGVVGYSSYQGRIVLEKALPLLKPDLVVVSFNFNDRRYVRRADARDGPEEYARTYRSSRSLLTHVTGILEYSHLFRGLRRLLLAAGLLRRPPSEADVTALVPRVDEESYRRNLTQIAHDARVAGVPVIFILLRDDPLQSDHLRKGIASLRHGDYDQAIAYLQSAVRARQMFADLARLYLVRALEAKGDSVGAKEARLERSFYDSFSGGRVIRLDTDYNDIMRAVARENDVEVVDGASLLEQHPEDFVDFCHFNADGHRRLGELLAQRIAATLHR